MRIFASCVEVFRLNPCMKTSPDPEIIRSAVRERYGQIAAGTKTLVEPIKGSGCCSSSPKTMPALGCCGPDAQTQARTLGYTEADLALVPAGSNLGLGCGNPVAIAALKPGQTVLDLGAGAGFDVFLAARAVGPTGRVIGVDMTPEMVAKARGIAKKGGYSQVEFRLGEIEALPVADATVEVVISNCVINLCPDKRLVYREAFRALRPGGRLAVSDVVAREELPDEVKRDLALHSGCLAGATLQSELETILKEVGFIEVSIHPKGNTNEVISSWEAKRGFEEKVFAAEVTALKPAEGCGASNCCS